jgi:hypothetical protein
MPVSFMASFLLDGLAIAYGVDLCWVGLDASVSDHEDQEQSGRDTEDTLRLVELPLELA